MRVLAAENISKRYGERALLSDVTLQINQGDKIGLIGVNGTGKSTLLRLLAGEEVPDGGSVFCQPGQRVAYLPQNPAFAPEDTVLEHVLRYAGLRHAGVKGNGGIEIIDTLILLLGKASGPKFIHGNAPLLSWE